MLMINHLKRLKLLQIVSNTLSKIIKNRIKIKVAYAVNQFEPARKKMCTGKNEIVEVALLCWIREFRSQNIILKGTILQEKGKFFGEALGVSNFICSNVWLSRFKECHEKESVSMRQLLIQTLQIHFMLKNGQCSK